MTDCQWDRKLKARKTHICDECGRTIPKGTLHHVQSGIQDGYPYRWRVHSDCAELYWEMNGNLFHYDEACPLAEFGLSEFIHLRGKYPHVICRFELRQQLREARKP